MMGRPAIRYPGSENWERISCFSEVPPAMHNERHLQCRLWLTSVKAQYERLSLLVVILWRNVQQVSSTVNCPIDVPGGVEIEAW